MKPDPENSDDWTQYNDATGLTDDASKPRIALVKTAEGQTGLPSGRFPLVSVQVMTLTELEIYAGNPIRPNLQIMRNEIFARYGYRFAAGGEMAKYFSAQEWYKPQYADVTERLTETEHINIALIQLLEKQ